VTDRVYACCPRGRPGGRGPPSPIPGACRPGPGMTVSLDRHLGAPGARRIAGNCSPKVSGDAGKRSLAVAENEGVYMGALVGPAGVSLVGPWRFIRR